MKKIQSILALLLLLGVCSAQAADHMGKPYKGSKAFERIKALAETWEGEMNMGDAPVKMTSTYKVTSGGSAVVETVFAGTPMEMVTLYHDDSKGRLTMVHYCMLHNQPKLTLKKFAGKKLSMTLAKDADVDAGKDEYMGALTMTFLGPDKISQRWSNFKQGKEDTTHSVEMVFKRVK